MGSTTILILDPIHSEGIETLGKTHKLVLPGADANDPQRAEADIAVVRTSPLGEAEMARLPRLKLIVKHGAGVDNIDIAAATRRGVMVANTPGGNNASAVAEGAVTMMLALLRRVRDMDTLVRSGRFDARWSVHLGDLKGARVGLIGFGRIARQVAKICGAGFGASVSAYDPVVSAEEMTTAGVEPTDLATIMACDIVSIHTPLTSDTRNLVGATQLGMMRPSAIIVNCSRGGIIDERALYDALSSGLIAGAGLDVLEQEPPPADHPLFALPNILFSPHVAGVTESGMRGMARQVVAVIEEVLADRRPATLLNPEVS